jgi:hypothetical protein
MMIRKVPKNHPVPEAGLPPFWSVMGFLSCNVISVAMIVWLLPGLLTGSLPAWAFLLAFCLVIGYSSRQLAVGLFPGRFLRCPVCTLVREIIEIDSTVR